MIRNETDYARHIEYCYINPVNTASSRACAIGRIRRFAATWSAEFSPLDWAGDVRADGEFGEAL